MKIVLGVAVVLLLALVGSRWTFTRIKLPFATLPLYLTGTEYVLVGLALGGLFLELLDEASLRGLQPLLHLAFGWIGFMFGAQLELVQIRRFSGSYLYLMLLQGGLTLLLCFLASWGLLLQLDGFRDGELIPGALLLATTAVPTAQAALALIHQEIQLGRNTLSEVLMYVASLDDVVGLVPFGLLFCFLYPSASATVVSSALDNHLGVVLLLSFSLGFGLAMGFFLHLLTRVRCSQEELLVFTVGIVLFAAGAAAYLRLSILFITMVGGIVVANLRGEKRRISQVLVLLEKPFYLIILLMAGAMLRPIPAIRSVLVLTLSYVGIRLVSKILGGFCGSHLFRWPTKLPASLGLGLTPQGGMAVAMVVSYRMTFPGPFSDALLVIVLLSMIVSELIGPALVHRALRTVT